MFRKFHWFNQWSSKPKNSLSLDNLRYLCNVMSKNNIVTEQNKTLLVETLRQIAEILIWGDQNDSTVFDFFLERNMLSFFLDIMKQKCGNYVTVQLLQTLNILFENIRHETSLYYLLSNNHVNSIILHKFDTTDEEVMAYYISFLKTLSFKLNPHTIHFFFNTSDFPLYTEAVKYFNHSEKMVRIAVRILTLNVFKVEEKSMLKFITGQTVPCLTDLVLQLRDNVINIEKCLREHGHLMPNPIDNINNNNTNTTGSNQTENLLFNESALNQTKSPINTTTATISSTTTSPPSPTYKNRLEGDKLLLKIEDIFAEHLDHLHYLNDILMLRIDDINRILSDNLMHHLIKPLVDAYKDDPHNSLIRLFTLEFTTGILSRVLATSLYDDETGDDDRSELNDHVGDHHEGRRIRLAHDVKDCDEKQDNLTNDKLSGAQLAIVEQSKEIAEIKVKTLLKTDTRQDMTYLSMFDFEYNEMKKKQLSVEYLLMESQPTGAKYQIRDFLLWRQLLLNIKFEKDRELSLKNTSWLSYAKLLQWLDSSH